MGTLLIGDIGRRSTANRRYSYAGAQDNGTSVRRPGLPGTDWELGVGTDGSEVAVDPANPRNAYGYELGAWRWSARCRLCARRGS